MHSPRDLRRRIHSIGNTSQITRAMELVAASKLRKAQERALAGRPFARLLYRIQREATTRLGDFTHPLLEKREVTGRAVILIAADRGLCGALNSNLFRLASDLDPQSTVFITAGRKASQFVTHTHRQLAAQFEYSDSPQLSEAKAIAASARDLFLKRQVDQVQIIATRFVNTMTQQALCLDYLPIGEVKIPGIPPEEVQPGGPEALFEPNPAAVMDYLLSRYLDLYLYQALLNAKASEQSARMVSMKNATDNADDLVRTLTLEYNKLRQGRITQELL
ncbi:MAG TPA: ATP synthase F1 subunit gamma, partial [Silvibacterium sp.]|nr:ATP synthase F1 subunit gamma [Silvibacterium sp.]